MKIYIINLQKAIPKPIHLLFNKPCPGKSLQFLPRIAETRGRVINTFEFLSVS